MDEFLARALASLEGLSVGDALGQALFLAVPEALDARPLPAGPWPWTDDTHMALSVIEALQERGRIDADPLAARFARRFAEDPDRGYGTGAMVALATIARGARWRDVSPTLFEGQGSLGNGAAMRAAPIGAWFAGDPERAAREASIAALPTHTHPDGIAGAAAVAAAAAVVSGSDAPSGVGLLDDVLPHVLGGELRDRIELALTYRPHEAAAAAAALGTGLHVRAVDTVPWCLWCVAHHAPDFEGALWTALRPLGDRDTVGAIVGGIVAARGLRPPAAWVRHREPLPADFTAATGG